MRGVSSGTGWAWHGIEVTARPTAAELRVLLHSRLLAVYGVWQRDVESGGEVRHLIAKRLVDLTALLGGLATQSREFH